MTETPKNPALRLRVSCFSRVGPVRGQNQDNYYVNGQCNALSQPESDAEARLLTDNPRMLALFDGMGGETAGEMASLLAVQSAGTLEKQLRANMPAEELAQLLNRYHATFLDTLGERIFDPSAVCGTTCVGAVLDGQRMTAFWMGDSRLYLLRGGRLRQLTRDDSAAQKMIDRGEITEEAARKTSDWHRLTRFMGKYDAEFSLAPDLTLCPGDRLLFCSDGVTDVCTDDALADILCRSIGNARRALLRIAERDTKDNATVILADVEAISRSGWYSNIERRFQKWLRSK